MEGSVLLLVGGIATYLHTSGEEHRQIVVIEYRSRSRFVIAFEPCNNVIESVLEDFSVCYVVVLVQQEKFSDRFDVRFRFPGRKLRYFERGELPCVSRSRTLCHSSVRSLSGSNTICLRKTRKRRKRTLRESACGVDHKLMDLKFPGFIVLMISVCMLYCFIPPAHQDSTTCGFRRSGI